jgi:polysaccharide export outer membrane protein
LNTFNIFLVAAARWCLVALVGSFVTACSLFSPAFPAAPALAMPATDYNYMTVPVRPDGKLTTPLIDELTVQGKTSVEVARDVEKLLAKFVRDPVVTVIVTGFVGPYSEQIRVVGEATKPQVLPYKNKMTVLDVMIAVGGLTDFADGNAATILRTAEGDKRYTVRLKDLIKRGDVSLNVEMRPGDILIIPQGWF